MNNIIKLALIPLIFITMVRGIDSEGAVFYGTLLGVAGATYAIGNYINSTAAKKLHTITTKKYDAHGIIHDYHKTQVKSQVYNKLVDFGEFLEILGFYITTSGIITFLVTR